eukprot:1991770-Prymnesium_polylepis.3
MRQVAAHCVCAVDVRCRGGRPCGNICPRTRNGDGIGRQLFQPTHQVQQRCECVQGRRPRAEKFSERDIVGSTEERIAEVPCLPLTSKARTPIIHRTSDGGCQLARQALLALCPTFRARRW